MRILRTSMLLILVLIESCIMIPSNKQIKNMDNCNFYFENHIDIYFVKGNKVVPLQNLEVDLFQKKRWGRYVKIHHSSTSSAPRGYISFESDNSLRVFFPLPKKTRKQEFQSSDIFISINGGRKNKMTMIFNSTRNNKVIPSENNGEQLFLRKEVKLNNSVTIWRVSDSIQEPVSLVLLENGNLLKY